MEGLERDYMQAAKWFVQVLGNPTQPCAGVRVWTAIRSVKPLLSHGRISTCIVLGEDSNILDEGRECGGKDE